MSSDDSCSNSSPNYNNKKQSLIKSSSPPVPGNAGNNKNSTGGGAEVDTTAASSASIRRRIKRKRKNCRSQFRHEAMEIIKLGSNVSSSLCKSKEPYVSKITAAEKKSQESIIQLSHNNNNNNVHTKNNNNNNSAHVDAKVDQIDPPPQPGFNPRADPPPAVYINASSSNTTTSSSTYIYSRPQTYPPANPNLNNNNHPQYQMFGGHHVLPQMVPERRTSRDGVIMSPPQNHHQSVIQGPAVAAPQQEHPRIDPRLYARQQLLHPSVVDMSEKTVRIPNERLLHQSEKVRLEKKMLDANDKLLHRLSDKAAVHSNEKVNLSDMVSRIKKVVHLNETLLHLNKKMHSNEMIETLAPANQKAQRDERSRPSNEKMVCVNERINPNGISEKTPHSNERLLHPNERLLYLNDRVARNVRMPQPRKLHSSEKTRVVFHSNGDRPPDMPPLHRIPYTQRQNQRPLPPVPPVPPPSKRARLDETAFHEAVNQINLVRQQQMLSKTTYDPGAAIDLTLPHASYHLKKCSERVPIRKIPAKHHCGQCTQEHITVNDYFRPQEVPPASRPPIIVDHRDTATVLAKRGRPLVAKAPSPPPPKNPVGRPRKPKERKNFIDGRPREVIDLTLSDEHARRSVLEDLRRNGAGGRTLEEILLQKKTDPQKKKPTFMIKDLISNGRPKERSPPRFAPSVIPPINSIDRRQSVDTLSSSSSTSSSNAEAINGHFLDSHATLIPRGKLRYDKASHSLCRYYEEDQKRLFLKATVNTPVVGAGHDQPKGSQSSEHIIPLPRHVLFNASENLTVEEYVREMTMVESLDKIPDFYQFYKFVTGYQICNNKTPVSFLTFLSIYNTDGLKKLLDRYVNSAMRRSV